MSTPTRSSLDNPVQVRDWTGTRAPMNGAPSGLVLLAEWPEDALDAYLAGELAAVDPPNRHGSE